MNTLGLTNILWVGISAVIEFAEKMQSRQVMVERIPGIVFIIRSYYQYQEQYQFQPKIECGIPEYDE